jgi:hypothetical protein
MPEYVLRVLTKLTDFCAKHLSERVSRRNQAGAD